MIKMTCQVIFKEESLFLCMNKGIQNRVFQGKARKARGGRGEMDSISRRQRGHAFRMPAMSALRFGDSSQKVERVCIVTPGILRC